MSLDQLLEFLSSSGHAGTLKISFKDKTCVLCLQNNLIYIDKRGQGEVRLGEVLVSRGLVEQHQVDEALAHQRQSKARIGDILVELGHATTEQLDGAFRAQLEEELYDLFVLEDAVFEFERGLPEGFDATDLPSFGVRSILMEAARRFDEWRHIKATITSRKLFYRLNDRKPDAEKGVSKALRASAAASDDGGEFLFGHERSIEETLPLLGMTQFEGLSLLANLISDGQLVPFTRSELENRFREFLIADLGRALKYYECALELDEFKSRQRQLDKLLFSAPDFEAEGGWKYSATIKGKRALSLLLSLFRQGISCEFYAREDERELRLTFTQDKLIWRDGLEAGTTRALEHLKSERLVSRNDLQEARSSSAALRGAEATLVHSGKLAEADWQRGLKRTTLDAMFDLIFWKTPFVQVLNGRRFDTEPREGDLEVAITDWLREELVSEVKDWERVTQIVPSVRSFFELTPKGRKGLTGPADDLRLFDGRRTLEQIMRLLRREPHEFFPWLYEQNQGGRVRPLEVTDYRKRVESSLEARQVRESLAYCAAAIDCGWQVRYFKERRDEILERHGEGTEDRQPAKLEGDLASFSLAEVLQSFHMSKRSGTLRIFVEDSSREKEIYFENGQVFLVEVEDDTGDFLLDAGFMQSLNATFEGKAVAQGLITEDELGEQQAEQIKEDVYEVFLWDGARFEFTRDSLPPEFYESSARVTKYSLNTAIFLMEAVRRIEQWDQIREVVPNDELVVKFESYETKMRAVTEKGHQETLLLIDGRHTISDILRISGARRFHSVALIAELLQEQTLSVADIEAEAAAARSEERAGEVDPGSFREVLESLRGEGGTGVLRVTDGRRSKEIAFVEGAPYRTTPFKHGTGNPEMDAELSTRFFARDFAELLIYQDARYQFLAGVLPPVLEEEGREAFALLAEPFLREFAQAGGRWQEALSKLDREQPLTWRDGDAQAQAAAVPAPANVLDWIDGTRSAEDIIRAHPDGRYLAFMSLAELAAAGVVTYAEVAADDGEDWDFGLD